MRESRDRRRSRPAVSQDRTPAPERGEWRTLREASELTGIPIGTLRKWCRRETVKSYLESDGELTLRMVEMGSVRDRGEVTNRQVPAARQEPEGTRHETRDTRHETPTRPPEPEPGTMIVPVDAWNKMLNQLGNLHEAGQQLAEARERAAKAETEALFLRERLAEMRKTSDPSPSSEIPSPQSDPSPSESSPSGGGGPSEARDGGGQTTNAPESGSEIAADEEEQAPPVAETAPFWRYVVRGWRGRRR